ncbi:MAG: hypothetical protein JW969_02525 [Spirochaetales bacterium]|nr:hypothetical protein [Spirochaetales bacterium]
MALRILFYAVNGLGLGHVTRLLSIAREIRRIEKGADILFLTSSESNVVYREGFPSVKVPSKNSAFRAGLEPHRHISILHQTAFSVFSSFDPHITVVDTFPHGFSHELDQVLRWKKSKFVYIYRQRKDDKCYGDYFQSLLRRYHLIIVPHDKGEPGVVAPEGCRVLCTGPVLIRNKGDLWPRNRVVSAFDLPNHKKRVLINMGGGGQENWTKIIESIAAGLLEMNDFHPVIAEGSLAPRLKVPGCTVLNDYFPVCELYNAFDAVIAGCGYNTVNETLYFGLPGIYIPFERAVDDQFRRARFIHDAGLGLYVDYSEIRNLPSLLHALLEPDRARAFKANWGKLRLRNNARKAARAILGLSRRRQ